MMLCEVANLARFRYQPSDPRGEAAVRAVSRKCVGDRRPSLGIETSQRKHQIPCLPGRSDRGLKLCVVVLRSYGKPEWLPNSQVVCYLIKLSDQDLQIPHD